MLAQKFRHRSGDKEKEQLCPGTIPPSLHQARPVISSEAENLLFLRFFLASLPHLLLCFVLLSASVSQWRSYSFSSSRRRLVCARDTGISLARLSFILSM